MFLPLSHAPQCKMRPPVSPLSTTTTRRTSCTLATRIPPNYEPGSRFRVLAMFLRIAIRRKYGIREECCT